MEKDWTKSYLTLKQGVAYKRQHGQKISTNEMQNYEVTLSELEQQLKVMSASLMEYEICASEVARRQVLMGNLGSQLDCLKSSSGITAGGKNRQSNTSSLYSVEYDTSNPASTVGRSSGASGLVGSPPGQPAGRVSLSMGNVITNPLRDTDANLMQRQRDVMKMQDSALLDIGKGVDRLHDQAKTIGEQANQQNVLLNALDEDVSEATDGLKAEAAHAQVIQSKGKVCYMYICVVVEVIILLALIILWLA